MRALTALSVAGNFSGVVVEAAVLEDPATRLYEAERIVHRNVLWGLGACLVPIPVVDVVAVTAVQVKTMAELSALYGVPFRESLARKLVFSLMTGVGGVAVGTLAALSLGKLIPGGGLVVSFAALQLFSGAFSYATGRVYVMHLESGGTLLSFDPRALREHYRREFEVGKRVARDLQRTASTSAPAQAAETVAATTAVSTAAAPVVERTTTQATHARPVVITAAPPVIPDTSPELLRSPASAAVVASVSEDAMFAAELAIAGPPPVNAAPFEPVAELRGASAGVAAALTAGLVDLSAASREGVVITKVHHEGAVKRAQADEYAEIINLGETPIDVSGWTLDADGAGQLFTFPANTTLAAGQVVRVYTDEVHPATGGFKFGIRRAIWNDSGDRARLRDASGAVVSVFAYGDKQ